jgi:KaiC/GvpD/RAD55 family RecA-like ATPase
MPMPHEALLSTGIPDLDALMGGFRVGDNVILQVDVGTPPRAFTLAFLREALARAERVVYVSFDHSPATVLDSVRDLPEGDLTVLDCFTHGKGRSESVFLDFYRRADASEGAPRRPRVVPVLSPWKASYFHEVFDEVTGAAGAPSTILVDSLTGMTELWHDEARVREFYTHTCPRLFDTRAIAVWLLNTRVHSEPFRAAIGGIAQVVITLARPEEEATLRVERAVGRNLAGMHRPRVYAEDARGVRLVDPKPPSKGKRA